MFTGLIQQAGKLADVITSAAGGRLAVETETWTPPLAIGESIAVQGACLTLTGGGDRRLEFDVLEETFRKTCLGRKKRGDLLNLERSLRLGDALGGHLVSGHVDGTGTVTAIGMEGRDRVVRIACERELIEGMVAKGSIAIDGISLTIVDLAAESFTVHMIPHTWDVTSFARLKSGDCVNLETDMLGKYVRRALAGGAAGGVSWDKLRDAGFLS